MVISKNLFMVQGVLNALKSKFENIEIYGGPDHSQLGISWDLSNPGEVKVSTEVT